MFRWYSGLEIHISCDVCLVMDFYNQGRKLRGRKSMKSNLPLPNLQKSNLHSELYLQQSIFLEWLDVGTYRKLSSSSSI